MSAQLTAACDTNRVIRERGHVLQLQGMSVNDGQGIRTVIFFSGCPLRCQWCANPETWTILPKRAVYHTKCTGCATCRAVCPASLNPATHDAATPAECTACGACAGECPSGALKILVQEMSTAEIVRRIERDAVFFRSSGGGVTFSGGEPTCQPGFLRSLVNAFFKRGIDLCMETCGYFEWDEVADIFAKMDRVLYDIKIMDETTHKNFTGVSNAKILDNCIRVSRMGIPVTVRIPVIRDLNGTRQNLQETARFIRDNLTGASVELLPYHDLGREKYRALGFASRPSVDFSPPTDGELEAGEDIFRDHGIPVVRYR